MTQVKYCCHLHPKSYDYLFLRKVMEDSLIKLQADFVDSSTGVIIAHSSCERTISLLKHEDVTRLVDSFLRGLRQNKSVALNMTLYRSKDVDIIVEPSLFDHVH